MRITHNIAALNTYRQLTNVNSSSSKSLEKLSSGYRINRAGDDAAGLAISEKMRAQIAGLDQASTNAQDGISLIQTAEGALAETHSILQRMRELAVQASTDSNTDSDRMEIQKEINQLTEEITRIGDTTEFNTMTLLDGTFSGTFHIGANQNQTMSLEINNMQASALKVLATAAVTTADAGSTNLSGNVSAATALKGGTYRVEVTTAGQVTLFAEDGSTIVTKTLSANGTSITLSIASGSQYLADATQSADIVLNISDNTAVSGVQTNAGTITLNVLQENEGHQRNESG